MKSLLPKERVFVALSIPAFDVSDHIKAMQDVQCHLTWIDVIMVSGANFFNFLWMQNNPDSAVPSATSTAHVKHEIPVETPSRPPAYAVFYDMNTAQMAQLYTEYSAEKGWNLELVESYVKFMKPKPSTAATTPKSAHRQARNPAAVKSYDEIFFICQFKNETVFSHDPSTRRPARNRLHHSVIDTRFCGAMSDMTKIDYEQMYMPIRVSPQLMHVNTATNKHIYYTALYKPIEPYKTSVDEFEQETDFSITPAFTHRKNLDDDELLRLHREFARNSWRLVDMKAYKTETGVSKFSAVWTSLSGFYEGTSMLLMGLDKTELVDKVNELNEKRLYPRLITNYGYVSLKGEHAYAVLFCQF